MWKSLFNYCTVHILLLRNCIFHQMCSQPHALYIFVCSCSCANNIMWILSFLLQALEQILLLYVYVHCASFCILCMITFGQCSIYKNRLTFSIFCCCVVVAQCAYRYFMHALVILQSLLCSICGFQSILCCKR